VLIELNASLHRLGEEHDRSVIELIRASHNSRFSRRRQSGQQNRNRLSLSRSLSLSFSLSLSLSLLPACVLPPARRARSIVPVLHQPALLPPPPPASSGHHLVISGRKEERRGLAGPTEPLFVFRFRDLPRTTIAAGAGVGAFLHPRPIG